MMLRFIIACLLLLAVPTQAKGQNFELSAGWAIPAGDLEEIVQDGVSLRGAYVWPITDSRNVALLVRVGITRFFDTDGVSGMDYSFLGGYRVQPSDGRYWFDLTAGPLTQRVTGYKSKTHFAASIDIGAIVVRRDGGGLGVFLSSTAADTHVTAVLSGDPTGQFANQRPSGGVSGSNWIYGGLGLVYRF